MWIVYGRFIPNPGDPQASRVHRSTDRRASGSALPFRVRERGPTTRSGFLWTGPFLPATPCKVANALGFDATIALTNIEGEVLRNTSSDVLGVVTNSRQKRLGIISVHFVDPSVSYRYSSSTLRSRQPLSHHHDAKRRFELWRVHDGERGIGFTFFSPGEVPMLSLVAAAQSHRWIERPERG